MELKELSRMRTALDDFDEKFYDFKEALINADKNTDILESFLIHSTKGIVLLFDYIANKNYNDNKALKGIYQSTLLGIICQSQFVLEYDLFKNNKSRYRPYPLIRQLHMALLHKTFKVNQRMAGILYGKDHATVNHSCKVVKNLYQTNKVFREEYSAVFEHCFKYDSLTNSTKTLDFLKES